MKPLPWMGWAQVAALHGTAEDTPANRRLCHRGRNEDGTLRDGAKYEHAPLSAVLDHVPPSVEEADLGGIRQWAIV